MGPFFLIDMLGLDTVLHVAEYLHESYGESFYVHKGMQRLVSEGHLGAKSGGDGFYKDGEPQIEGDADPNAEELADLFVLKSLVEACKLLEEGVSTVREIDLGMMAGAGLDPARALPAVLEGGPRGARRDAREAREIRRVTASASRRRAPRSGSSPRAGWASSPARASTPIRRERARAPSSSRSAAGGDRLAQQPADERDLSPGDPGPGKVWEEVKSDVEVKAMVVYSSLPVVFSLGRTSRRSPRWTRPAEPS